MIVAFIVGISITFLIWICHDLLGAIVPLPIFNLMGILRIPGIVLTLIITAIVLPQKGWQAIHEVPPFSYFTYAGNFLFYFLLSFIIQFLIVRYKKGI
jgi:hypothetical protein